MTKNTAEHFYIVIMAGGTGTRLWPLSRREKPKQFQSFISEKTMIRETFERVQTLVPEGHIFVSTSGSYQDLVLKEIPEISHKNLILEPVSRNTAPAIALVAATLFALDPAAIIATIASDHAIENTDEFRTTLHAALVTAEEHTDKLVTVGINPTRPDTGLGYIHMGSEFATVLGKRVFTVDAFQEKPNRETAEEYLASWDYLWNAGYFIFSAATFSEWTKEFAPALSETIQKIIAAKQSGALDETTLEKLYSTIPNEPVEPLIVEKLPTEKRLVIPSPLKWSDVGNWDTLYDFIREKSGASSIVRGDHLDIGSKNIFVHGDTRLIATIGVEDLVIIDTPDALLVARRDHVSTEIKNLIEQIKSEHKTELL